MQQNTLAPWAEAVPGANYPLSEDQLLALQDDEWQYELVDGRLVRMAPTGLEHLDITERLYETLRTFVMSHGLGRVTLPDTGFRLSKPGEPDTVLSPDVAFVSSQRMQQLPAPGTRERKRFVSVAPDLAAEVVSPDQYHPEMAKKALLYLDKGVRLVWIIWPDQQQVEVWCPGSTVPIATLGMAESLDGLDVLPGFTLSVAYLLA